MDSLITMSDAGYEIFPGNCDWTAGDRAAILLPGVVDRESLADLNSICEDVLRTVRTFYTLAYILYNLLALSTSTILFCNMSNNMNENVIVQKMKNAKLISFKN